MPPPAGLCAACRYSRIITGRKGSRFTFCERSREDPAFPRYPSLPVLTCAGFQQRGPDHHDHHDPESE